MIDHDPNYPETEVAAQLLASYFDTHPNNYDGAARDLLDSAHLHRDDVDWWRVVHHVALLVATLTDDESEDSAVLRTLTAARSAEGLDRDFSRLSGTVST